METLFIADDERSIRDGLKCILDWESLGFKLCGEAGNGEEALQQLVALNPNLALLDVRMPKMMGTEVLRRARASGFTGKCIILSGYSDFTYAQEAIESGVSLYITKPLDEDELYAAVTKIKEELDVEKAHSSNLISLKSKAKEVFLRELVHGETPNSLSSSDMELLHFTSDSYQVVICERFTNAQNSSYSLSDLFKATRRNNDYFDCFYENGLEVILLKGSYGQNRLSDVLEHFDEETEEGSPLSTLFITYGQPVDSIDNISRSYDDASTLLKRHFFCPKECHYMGYEELPSAPLSEEKIPERSMMIEFSDKLKEYIQSFNHQMVADTLQSVMDYLVETTSDIYKIKMFLTDLYWQVKENIIRVYPNATIPFPPASTVIDFIEHANYLYEIIRFLSEQCTLIMDATGNPSRDSILDDILYYIDHNYTGNIKLEMIAPLFGYNSAYLGKIFHKAVGMSFNSYIDHKRIEASKVLLENESCKVYEIAEQIGYKNVDYFHKKFRKYVGISPAEYRKRSD